MTSEMSFLAPDGSTQEHTHCPFESLRLADSIEIRTDSAWKYHATLDTNYQTTTPPPNHNQPPITTQLTNRKPSPSIKPNQRFYSPPPKLKLNQR